ncbi:MAG: TatD family hydrolase [Candidatus Coatesbacteria bacterium]|nr:TatD family hydrolase [Candidatus Coatesbacteria bacterium]
MSKYPGLIDSHCHLTSPKFEDDIDAVIGRAREAGIENINVVGYTLEHSLKAIELANRFEGLWASIGVSPHDAKDAPANFIAQLSAIAEKNRDRVVAIGETGLDFYHRISPPDDQVKSFEAHIELAIDLSLPLVIHTRSAFEMTIDILKSNGAERVGGVFHCFTGTPSEATIAMSHGFFISFSGIITFRNATDIRESARIIPDNRLLIETDAPYLAPIPNRGKRNEPAYTCYIAEELARIRKTRPENIVEVTSRNARQLFSGKFTPCW